VIDELMGHSGGPQHDGSPMAKVYRHTTPEMRIRAAKAIEDRLAIALDVAQMWPKGAQTEEANRTGGNAIAQ
jgi:hypothetical protein